MAFLVCFCRRRKEKYERERKKRKRRGGKKREREEGKEEGAKLARIGPRLADYPFPYKIHSQYY